MSNQLIKFLKKHKVDNKTDNEYSHVSMGFPFGKFNIVGEDLEEFYNLYVKCINKFNMYIAEKSIDISPFIIDIDFVQKSSYRKYNFNNIIELLSISNKIIQKYYQTTQTELISVILEKNAPTSKLNNYKDGFHIIYPFIASSKKIRLMMLDDICNLAKSQMLFNDLELLNDLDDIIDKHVVNVPWLMLGSKKPNGFIYNITSIIKNLQKIYYSHVPLINMVKFLSNHKFANSQEKKLIIETNNFNNINNELITQLT